MRMPGSPIDVLAELLDHRNFNVIRRVLEEEQHLDVPVIGRQGPPVAKHDGLTVAPVLT
jgi:hypothetical protein